MLNGGCGLIFYDLNTRKGRGIFWIGVARKQSNLMTGPLNTFNLGVGRNGMELEMSLEKKQ